MAKTKYKHQQVMKLCVMTEEDVFGDKQTIEEMMEIVADAINNKRFYFELINPPKKEKEWQAREINQDLTTNLNSIKTLIVSLINEKERNKMAIKLLLTSAEKQLLIDALADKGKVLVDKEKTSKLTRDEQKEMNSIEKIIHQIAFGREY